MLQNMTLGPLAAASRERRCKVSLKGELYVPNGLFWLPPYRKCGTEKKDDVLKWCLHQDTMSPYSVIDISCCLRIPMISLSLNESKPAVLEGKERE